MRHIHRESHSKVAEPPPAVLYEQIRGRIAATKAPRTRTHHRVIWALVVATVITIGVVWLASHLVYGDHIMGLSVYDESMRVRLLGTLLLLIGMTLVATLIATWRGRGGFGASVVSLALAAALVAPLYALVTLVEPVHPSDITVSGVTISPWGVRCAFIAGVVGVVVMASFAIALRRAVPVASRLRGAVLGAAAGAWAGLAVFVFCPSGELRHLALGHVIPVAVLILVGMLVTPRLLRP